MPDKYTPAPKKKAPTAHERRMYNKYARHAISAGGDVDNMDVWLAKQDKKKKKEE